MNRESQMDWMTPAMALRPAWLHKAGCMPAQPCRALRLGSSNAPRRSVGVLVLLIGVLSAAPAGPAAPVAQARALPMSAGMDETGHAESARISRSIESFRVFLSRLPNQVAAGRHRFEFRPRDTPQSLRALAGHLGFPVPMSLAALLTETGAFHNPEFADVWQTIELYSTAELLQRPTGLVAAIEHDWGDRPELRWWFGAAARSRIDGQTAVFGMRYEDDDVHDYLYFDSRGRFDHVYFDQDSPESARAKLESILKGKEPGLGLADLLDAQPAAMRAAIAKDE